MTPRCPDIMSVTVSMDRTIVNCRQEYTRPIIQEMVAHAVAQLQADNGLADVIVRVSLAPGEREPHEFMMHMDLGQCPHCRRLVPINQLRETVDRKEDAMTTDGGYPTRGGSSIPRTCPEKPEKTDLQLICEILGVGIRCTVEEFQEAIVRCREQWLREGRLKQIETPFGTIEMVAHPLLEGDRRIYALGSLGRTEAHEEGVNGEVAGEVGSDRERRTQNDG